MNSFLNITIRVRSAGAAAIRQVQNAVKQLQSATSGISGGLSRLSDHFGSIEKFGKDLQWTGRQIEYRITLPLVAAGTAAAKFAMNNEAAIVRLRKVYGSLDMPMQQVNSDVTQLGHAFEALSNIFGVAQADVIGIGADWAQAGASGIAVAKATRLTLEAMVLGEIDAAEATKDLIAVQAQWGLNTDQLKDALAVFNIIENETAVSFKDLIDAQVRGAGAARAAGVDYRHLSAMVAAIVPAAGTAAQAGNGLKTMLTRIMVPGKDAAELFGKMGINVNDASWQMKNGTQRVEALAQAFTNLTPAQQNVVAKTAAGLFQISRFDVLMRDIASGSGYYAKALNASADATRNMAQYSRELGQVLSSDPQAFKILWTQLQNALAKIIVPLIPAILALVNRIVRLVDAFTKLNPGTQQFVLFALAALAALGPLMAYLGTFQIIIGAVGKGLLWFFVSGENHVAGITRLYDAFKLLGQAVYWIAKAPFTVIANGFGFIWRAALASFKTAASVAGWFWSYLVKGFQLVGGVISTVWNVVTNWIAGLFGRLAASSGASATASATAQAGAAQWVYAWMSSIYTAIGTTVAGAYAGMVAAGESAFAALGAGAAGYYGEHEALAAGAGAAEVAVAQSTALATVGWWTFMGVRWEVFVATVVTLIEQGAIGIGTAFAAIGAAWTELVAALEAGAGVMGTAIAELEAGFLALLPGPELLAVGWAGAMTAIGAATEAVVTEIVNIIPSTGLVWVATNATIVESTIIAGNEIVTIWTGVAGYLEATFQTIGPAALTAAAETTAAFGELPPAIAIPMGAVAAEVGMALEALPVGALAAVEATAIEVAAGGQAIAAAATAVGAESGSGAGAGFLASFVAFISGAGEIALIGAAIAAALAVVGAVIYHFRDSIAEGFRKAVDSIVNAFHRLPGAVAAALRAVMTVIQRAMKSIIDSLSYLNPFARHSPSLVENVQAGVDLIARKYASLRNIGASFRAAVADLKAFSDATAGAKRAMAVDEYAQQRKQIVAAAPGAGPAADTLFHGIEKLQPVLEAVGREYAAQDAVVASWDQKLQAANDALDQQKTILDGLKASADAAKNELDAAQSVLDKLSRTPIAGMKAMNDQIFANEQAQKQLRLEILKMEQAGQSVDDYNNKLAAMAGEIEKLRGEATDLRMAGAGSDVLGPIADQITQLENAQKTIEQTGSPITALQQQLDELQRQGEILNLTYSTTFDPLTKQIDDVTNAVQEMPFDQLMQQITAQKGEVARLTAVWDQADAAVRQQQATVDQLTAARDAIQKSYDAEKAKLDQLAAAYDGIDQQIKDMTAALDDFASKAKSAAESAAAAAFDAAQAGNYDVPGGNASLGNEQGDIQALADQWAKEASKSFGSFDIFKPVKDLWKKTWSWIKDTTKSIGSGILDGLSSAFEWAVRSAGPVWRGVVGGIKSGLDAVGITTVWNGVSTGASRAWDAVSRAISSAWSDFIQPTAQDIAHLFSDTLEPVLDDLGKLWQNVWGLIGDALQWVWDKVIEPIWKAIKWDIDNVVGPAFELIKTVVETVWDAIGTVISVTWNHLIKPIWDIIYAVITTALVPVFQMLRAVAEIVFAAIGAVVAVFWYTMVKPIFDGLVWTLQNVVGPVFNWLWHNVAEPAFGAIGKLIQVWWDTILHPIFDGIKWVIENVLAPVFNWLWHDVIAKAFDGIVSIIKTGVNSMIDYFNTLADGVNWIADKLGLSVHVDHIPHVGQSSGGGGGGGGTVLHMARGGMVPGSGVGAGFITDGIRAIVGEGSRTHPEFVIPTDPQHRGRALQLAAQLLQQLGTPAFAGGGILGSITDAASSVAGSIRNTIVDTLFGPAKSAAEAMIRTMPVAFMREIAQGMLDRVIAWVGGQAYDSGGILRPGYTLAYNGTGRNEHVLTADQYGSRGAREIHFHGDLMFPNVKGGADAEDFLRNLERLVTD